MDSGIQLDGTTLARYTGSEAQVVVPAGVTRIGLRAFAGNRAIRSVILPDTVGSIEFAAFSGCVNLREVLVPYSVVSVGCGAFAGCSNLRLRFEGRYPQVGFEPDPELVFVAPKIPFEETDERFVLALSLAAGKVVLAAEGKIADVGEACRTYLRGHGKRVARLLDYDPACMRWLAVSGVFVKRQLAELAAECANAGHTESAAVFTEAAGADSRKVSLLL